MVLIAASDAIRKKHLCFFLNMFFFCIKNLASKKKTLKKMFFFQNTHLKEITS